MSLAAKIKKIYPSLTREDFDVTHTGTIMVQNDSDGKGDYIKEWNVSGLDKPTDEQLATYETAGNTEETNNTVRATRRAAYGDIGDQLDEIYKDIDAWKTRIKAIKDANPKS